MSDTTLPQELITSEILSRLPVKAIIRFKSVCKAWHTSITDPGFVKFHLNRGETTNNNGNHDHKQLFFILTQNHYSILDGNGHDKVIKLQFPFEINPLIRHQTLTKVTYYYKMRSPFEEEIGYCNGLLCFIRTDGDRDVILWNPSIREYQTLPDPSPPQSLLHHRPIFGWGFGFHPKTGEYKIVRIAQIHNTKKGTRHCRSQVKVYTVGSGSWRELPDIPYSLCLKSSPSSQALVNGVLHWNHCTSEETSSTDVILSFDIEDEQFREVPQPVFGEGPANIQNLGALGGCLSMLVKRKTVHWIINSTVYEIWVMVDYGVKKSWMKKFTFNSESLGTKFRPWRLLDNGEILYRVDGGKLRLYSVEYETAPRSFNNRGFNGGKLALVRNYVESLVSPRMIENKVEEQEREGQRSALSTNTHTKKNKTSRS